MYEHFDWTGPQPGCLHTWETTRYLPVPFAQPLL